MTGSPPHNWMEQVRSLTLQLVGQASVNGTRGEAHFSSFLLDLLRQQPYFRNSPEHLWLEPVPEDPLGRSNVVAMVRGKSRATVMLTGHFDVVSVATYGELEPWAFAPDALLPRLTNHLERYAQSAHDKKALDDLRSGNYLPGRGALDMKSGLAAGIAVLLRYSQLEQRTGNLLLIASPDEENRSAGIRAAAVGLRVLERKWDLEIASAINLDATSDPGDGTDGQAVYLGSAGKLLLSVLLIGRDTHVGHPFDGVNSTLLAAEVIRHFECNAGMADFAEGEQAPPPTALKLEDLKQHYDVTTPGKTWCCINILTHQLPARSVLERAMQAVLESLDTALRYLQEQARLWNKAEQPANPALFQSGVYTFEELRRLALERAGEPLARDLKRLEAELEKQPELDLPTASRKLTEFLWQAGGLAGPAAVVGFASVPYPSVYLEEDQQGLNLRRLLEREMQQLSADFNTPIRFRSFFSGISDMSFLGPIDKSDLQQVAANMPAWNYLRFDPASLPGLPVINIGPWGRDYHQYLERVHVPYSFQVLPELVWRVATGVLAEK